MGGEGPPDTSNAVDSDDPNSAPSFTVSPLTVTEYVFTIYDSWGDGICCGYGSGAYSVTVNGETVKDGAEFGSSESTAFEVSGGPSPTKAPTGAPTKTPTKAPTTAPTFFSCAQYSEASWTDDKGCQW